MEGGSEGGVGREREGQEKEKEWEGREGGKGERQIDCPNGNSIWGHEIDKKPPKLTTFYFKLQIECEIDKLSHPNLEHLHLFRPRPK